MNVGAKDRRYLRVLARQEDIRHKFLTRLEEEQRVNFMQLLIIEQGLTTVDDLFSS